MDIKFTTALLRPGDMALVGGAGTETHLNETRRRPRLIAENQSTFLRLSSGMGIVEREDMYQLQDWLTHQNASSTRMVTATPIPIMKR